MVSPTVVFYLFFVTDVDRVYEGYKEYNNIVHEFRVNRVCRNTLADLDHV